MIKEQQAAARHVVELGRKLAVSASACQLIWLLLEVKIYLVQNPEFDGNMSTWQTCATLDAAGLCSTQSWLSNFAATSKTLEEPANPNGIAAIPISFA